jgi:Zn-dependent metalloprotease
MLVSAGVDAVPYDGGVKSGGGTTPFPDPVATAKRIAAWTGFRAAERPANAGVPETPVLLDPRFGTPAFLSGADLVRLTGTPRKPAFGTPDINYARAFIADNHTVFGIDEPAIELELHSEHTDTDGRIHLVFSQMYDGIPLLNHRIALHFGADGAPYTVNGRYAPTPSDIGPVHPTLSADDASLIARADCADRTESIRLPDNLRQFCADAERTPELVIAYDDASARHRVAWLVWIDPNLRERWRYLVDAADGSVFDRFLLSETQASVSATGSDFLGAQRSFHTTLSGTTYYLVDNEAHFATYDAHGEPISRFRTPTIVSSPNNTWDDAIAVSAHANARASYEYFLTAHGRDGLDGVGVDVPIVVHYSEDGTLFDNAFWNGRVIALGDARPYAAALDVITHELTHGLVQYTAGLIYEFQSGALNEHFCDVFAAMVDPDWRIGEDLPTGAIRDLADPTVHGLPAHMDDYRELTINQDSGGVHINMSIPSHACYRVAQDIGRKKTADIWYRTLALGYLTPMAEFIDFRFAAMRAAADLYGDTSAEHAAVENAFDAVGIVGLQSALPPEDRPAATGEHWVAALEHVGGENLIAVRNIDTGETRHPATVPVLRESGSQMSVCRNGSLAMFVGSDNNLWRFSLETAEASIADDSGTWYSIAVAPCGTRFAATSVFPDTTIYVFDLDDPDQSASYILYSPGTEGASTSTAVFADALDWSHDSTKILYDVFNEFPTTGGVIANWEVNVLDTDTGIISRVKTPTAFGIQVGNPSYAETNDRYIACDLFSIEGGISMMVNIDLFTLEIVSVRDTGFIGGLPNLGKPRYGPDDTYLVYQHYFESYDATSIMRRDLASDHLSPEGTESLVMTASGTPFPFARNEMETVVARDTASEPVMVQLLPAYPNPFNPRTTIPFVLDDAGYARLAVYDVLGRHVTLLADGMLPAGRHDAVFDGSGYASGLYLFRLEASGETRTGRMLLLK